MRINSTYNISFKGYDAAPIKNLYMFSFIDRGQENIRRELNEIGKTEGFEASIEENGKLYKGEEKPSKENYIAYKWAQDNKIIIDSQEGRYVLNPANQRNHGYLQGKLDKFLQVRRKESTLNWAGGNIYLGKKPDGEKYILIGNDVILDNSIKEYLKDIDCWYGNDRDIYNFEKSDDKKEEKLDFYSKSEQPRPRKKEFKTKQKFYAEKVKEMISEDFDVKKENIFVVPQQIFHIDMFLRPIGYPYILVNTEEKAKELVADNLGYSEKESDIRLYTRLYYDQLRKDNKGIKTKSVINSLKEQGFIPIEIGGIFGMDGMANFMNAIVNKHEDGTITYITNSSECEREDYVELQKRFDKQLRENVPNLRDTHYIYAGRAGQINLMMESLMENSGGLHCMVCEEPNFEVWA